MADFYPNTFIESEKLVHRYLLVPDQTTIPSRKPFGDIRDPEWRSFIRSIKNVSEWMAVNKGYFDMSGFSCNKIGVSYTAFRRQPHPCTNRYGR